MPVAYGAPQPQYGMPPNVYNPSYGRGYAQAAPTGYAAPPQQGKKSSHSQIQENTNRC